MNHKQPLPPTGPPRLRSHAWPRPRAGAIDLEREPVVFAWLLYREDGYAFQLHLETLYRLDRVGGAAPEPGTKLQPSVYYGQSAQMLRGVLRARQATLLPPPPPGCWWRGPELVTDASAAPTSASWSAATAGATPAAGAPGRLGYARALAAHLLHPRRE